jgi:hypothetical protein
VSSTERRTQGQDGAIRSDGDAAKAVSEWARSRTHDDVGAIVDAVFSLAQAAPEHFGGLAEDARRLLEAEADRQAGNRAALVALAGLLERTAAGLRQASQHI